MNLSVCLSVCHWIIIHISESIRVRNLKLYHNILKASLLGQVGRAHCQRQVAFLLIEMNNTATRISSTSRIPYGDQ